MAVTAVVTGASSFVGAHLVHAFAAAGYAVVATHSRPMESYDGIAADRLRWAGEAAELRPLDITDAAAVQGLGRDAQPKQWVHHAGFATDYASSYYDLDAGHAVNVAPLQAVFETMAGTGGGVLITGSSAEYTDGDAADREADACAPALPYGVSKLAETEEARRLTLETGVPCRVGRLYIPFGAMDNPKKLLAAVIAALKDGVPVDLSPCTQKRDFIGIADVADAWLKMADDLSRTPFDIFNICGGAPVALRDLLLGIADAAGADPALLRFGAREMRPGEAPVSYGDNTKARDTLNWTPRPLDAAIREDLLA